MGLIPPIPPSLGARVVVAQLNLVVGDVDGNAERIIEAAHHAEQKLNADLILFPELTLTGYPPEDLLLRPALYEMCARAIDRICSANLTIDVVIGVPERDGERRTNNAVLIRGGRVLARYAKQCLPNYTVFDEKRYFDAGHETVVVDVRGIPMALSICEDIWEAGPAHNAAAAGAKVLLNLNASPFHVDKWREREHLVCARARDNQLSVIYANLVGGQDELVFDGHSFVVDAAGTLTHRAEFFEPGLMVIDLDGEGHPRPGPLCEPPEEEAMIYQALVLGVHDYIEKNGFPGVVVGLSGGIDSALTLAIAVDAFGAERVEAVMMPSDYTSEMSLEDARAQAENLGVRYSLIPIRSLFAEFETVLMERFAGLAHDTTEENLQARIRGTLLMAISNKSGALVLTTGNKSEMAVGYATLYGDMAGGFAVIKDVPKTMVYRLARYRNELGAVIPERVLSRPPSAELAPDQVDSDSLPPYDVLDPILKAYVEEDASIEQIVESGFDLATVQRVAQMVLNNEYKRRQAPPGVRVTPRAFGRDRRYPISSGFGLSDKH